MEIIFNYLKRNIKLSFKSVMFHFKQYLCFFIALFVIQMFYGVITVASDNNNEIELSMVNAEYNYHLVLKDLNADQYYFMMNDELTVFANDHIHDIVDVKERHEKGSFNNKYDMYIALKGDDIDSSFNIFKSRYYQPLSQLNEKGLRVSTTPLLTFNQNLAVNTVSYVTFCLILTIISVFFLMSLYGIRINHYKFEYGIYMTFGADYKKLVETSFWEMMFISIMTFLPASLCSYLINFFIYRINGEMMTFHPINIVKILIFSLIIAALSVLLPTWNFTRKTPMSLIISEDNSNLVISPRRSFEFAGIKFPFKYELFSLWRFRKYNIQLLFTSILFTSLFMCTLFYANLYNVKLNYDTPQFVVKFSGNDTYNETMNKELYSIDGITNIEKSISTSANELSSHILIDKSDMAALANLVIPSDDTKRATNFVKYSPADSEVVEYLKHYKHDGDLSRLLADENSIIVSDSYDNTKKFNYQVGDKIQIAKFVKKIRPALEYTSGNELLKSELQYYSFDYTEYTICAILRENPTFGAMPLYMNNSAYEYLTGKDVKYNIINVYIDQDMNSEEVRVLDENLRQWAEYYDSVTVANKRALSLHNIETSKQTYLCYVCIAFLILMISPLMWFFTQTLFYLKRESEFSVIQAFGAIMDEIRKIFITDGLFCGISGIITCIVLNYGGIYVIYKFVNVVLPKFTNTSIRYSFYMPIIPLILGLLTALGCGFFSAYVQYRSYEKKHRIKNNISDNENE